MLGKRKIASLVVVGCALAGLLAAGGAAQAYPAAPVYGTDVRMGNASVTGTGDFQIDINPLNNAYAVGAGNDTGTAGVAIFRSTDGGQTWTAHDASDYGVPAACCNPSVVYGADGTVYVSILDTSPAATYVLRSTDNGATWQGPSQMATADYPALAADPSNASVLYLTYSDLPATNRIKGYKSTDGGVTWGASFFVGDVAPAQGYEQASVPRVASNGWLYVGYQQYTDSAAGCAGGVQNVVARSTDGGASFSYTVVSIVQGGACSAAQAGRGIFCVNSAGSYFRSRSHPIILVNPDDPLRVYMIYSGGEVEQPYTCAGATGYHSDILFRKSTDGGVTFSAPSKVNDDAPGHDQFLPWAGITQAGQIWVGWLDRREDASDFLARWYQTYTNDEGATWLTIAGTPGNDPVGDVQILLNSFTGLYNGLSARNGRVLGMWWQNLAGSDAYTDPQVPMGAPTSTPTATPPAAPTDTPTNPPAASPTPTNPPANTATPVPPTGVPTDTPSAPSPTATPVPPTATSTACVMHFQDVPADYWAAGYIRWAYCRGVVSGYGDGTFRPEAATTRAQIAKMVVLAAGFPLVLPPGAPHFSDVPPGSPFYLFVEVAYAQHVISGYGDGTFHPFANVTRAQLAKMIVSARGLALVTPPTPTFRDVPAGYWAYAFVETATAHAIVGGYACGGTGEPCPGAYFRPDTAATRAQLAKMLYQAFGTPPY